MPPHEVTQWAGLTTIEASELSAINDYERTPQNDHFAEVIVQIEEAL